MAGTAKVVINRDTLASTRSLACVLGVSEQRIRQLVADQVLIREGRGTFRLAQNVQAYFNNRDKQKSASYEEEHTLLEKAKRETAEIQLAKMKGDLHETGDIEIMVGGLVSIFKRDMLAIPHKLAKQLEGKSTVEINGMLTKEINDALTELSHFDAAKLEDAMNGTEEDD